MKCYFGAGPAKLEKECEDGVNYCETKTTAGKIYCISIFFRTNCTYIHTYVYVYV
jgi:hypothetical protein